MIISGNEVGLKYLKIERSLINFAFHNESFIDRIVQIRAGFFFSTISIFLEKKKDRNRNYESVVKLMFFHIYKR